MEIMCYLCVCECVFGIDDPNAVDFFFVFLSMHLRVRRQCYFHPVEISQQSPAQLNPAHPIPTRPARQNVEGYHYRWRFSDHFTKFTTQLVPRISLEFLLPLSCFPNLLCCPPVFS